MQGKKAICPHGVNGIWSCSTCRHDYASHYSRKPETLLKETERNLRRNYDMSLDDYDRLLTEQGGVCAICHNPPSGKGRNNYRLHVDHDHETGKVRGLLCNTCNRGIGLMKDNPEVLRSAADYLEAA